MKKVCLKMNWLLELSESCNLFSEALSAYMEIRQVSRFQTCIIDGNYPFSYSVQSSLPIDCLISDFISCKAVTWAPHSMKTVSNIANSFSITNPCQIHKLRNNPVLVSKQRNVYLLATSTIQSKTWSTKTQVGNLTKGP